MKIVNNDLAPIYNTIELKNSYSSGSVVGGDLQGKRVLITGGSGGIGLASCIRFLREGCLVYFTVRDETKLINTKQYLSRYFLEDSFTGVMIEQTNDSDIDALIKNAKEWNIDILINNIGILTDCDRKRLFRGVTKGQLEKSWRTNYEGTRRLTQGILKNMDEQNIRGSVVSVASICALYDRFSYTPYGMTKKALIAFSEQMKDLYPEMNIHVVAPGAVATSMESIKCDDDISRNINYLKRMVLPEEVAASVAVLSSSIGKHISNVLCVMSAGESL